MAQPLPSPPPVGATAPARRAPRTARRRLLADRAARWLVVVGGLAIIAGILGILIFILIEVWPLTGRAEIREVRVAPLAAGAEAIVVDEDRTHVAALGLDGRARAVRLADGAEVAAAAAATGEDGAPLLLSAAVSLPEASALAGATQDGHVAVVPVAWATSFDEAQARTITPTFEPPILLDLDPTRRALGAFAARLGDSGGATAAAQLADGTLAVVRRTTTQNLMTGEVTAAEERYSAPLDRRLTALVLDVDGRSLFAGSGQGELLWWELSEAGLGQAQAASAGRAPVTTLEFLLGGRSLVVGQEDGSLSIWFPVRQSDESHRLTRVRDFPRLAGPVSLLAPSLRNKGFLAHDRAGNLGLYHSTSERTLWRGRSPLPGATALFFAPKADGAFLAGQGRLAIVEVDNPHPEVSWRALFGKIWYEGYGGPQHVWQSTGGTDDFEPKLSLTPLLVGTLKGTLYALLLAIPLGVLGAMYASQFMHPNLLRFVKPTVEIMAALPSVVLGFLAGLWLAPALERFFPALLLMAIVLPVLVLLTGGLWRVAPRALRGRFPTGIEVFLYAIVLGLGVWGCLAASDSFANLVFGGSFQNWLRETTGLPYDQRNAVVVGLAMGFAVIPIIFAISEDAFSNVPRDLVAGSLALGANRWQTVTRVVLPTASPGIFSAIMIGFGRAVGETMIVLMATGNTPIMSWNPFNGFRTLSANIAVEIPEAPHGGTLYRTLFLAALLLFLLTFTVNTAAELVRQRLRRRYANL